MRGRAKEGERQRQRPLDTAALSMAVDELELEEEALDHLGGDNTAAGQDSASDPEVQARSDFSAEELRALNLLLGAVSARVNVQASRSGELSSLVQPPGIEQAFASSVPMELRLHFPDDARLDCSTSVNRAQVGLAQMWRCECHFRDEPLAATCGGDCRC